MHILDQEIFSLPRNTSEAQKYIVRSLGMHLLGQEFFLLPRNSFEARMSKPCSVSDSLNHALFLEKSSGLTVVLKWFDCPPTTAI